MKKILCFGDSNTYGFNPSNGSRFSSDIRWAGLLRVSLKNQFQVVEAGCNNRTCFSDNPDGIEVTGYKVLPKYLKNDIDILLLAIGVNDLQKIYSVDENDFKTGFIKFINLAYSVNKNLKIIILSPSVLTKNILGSYFSLMFDETSIQKSYMLPKILKMVAIEKNCDFIDLNLIANVSDIDGLHYDENGHRAIAEHLQNYFLNLT